MNGKARRILYQHVAEKKGEFCRHCNDLPTYRQLVIDHINNDNSDNREENLQLLCRPCKHNKSGREAEGVCESEREGIGNTSSSMYKDRNGQTISNHPTELETSRQKKPEFKRFVHQSLARNEGWVEEEDLLNSAAEYLDISQQTAKRYLDAMCSSYGVLERFTIDTNRTGIRYTSKDLE